MSETPITIRKATLEDAERIAGLSAEVFLESYRYPHEQEEMTLYLEEKFNKETISEELQDKNIIYFVTVTDTIVGFVKVNMNKWTWRFKGRLTFEVERLYIQKDMLGKKIGSRLMTTALEAAQKRGFRILWLTVWENNKKAIAFHQRVSFSIIGDGLFTLGTTQRTYLAMQKDP